MPLVQMLKMKGIGFAVRSSRDWQVASASACASSIKPRVCALVGNVNLEVSVAQHCHKSVLR